MELIIILIISIASGVVGIAIGWFLRFIIALGQKGSMEIEIKEMMLKAREEAEKIKSAANEEAEETLKETKEEIKKEEERLQKTEDRLINKESLLDKRQTDLDQESEDLKQKNIEIAVLKEELENLCEDKVKELEKITELNKEEAKELLIQEIQKMYEEDLNVRIQKIEISNKEKIEKKAQEIITTAIQRLAVSLPTDVFTNIVDLPSDEMKGKIIGKEGRNIKTFERMTGVELIIDDTPGAITLSSYDPVRREIARVALENLIKDGRIQPVKIEQFVEKAKENINQTIREQGEKAAFECGIFNLDQRILLILGRLYYRTSYGQNVLKHSIEMAHLAGMIAEEIGANVKVAKTAALLHDIGKAVDHEVAGSHVEIGRRILQKFGVSEEIIKAMQAHHEEYPFETVESVIVYIADAISGSRPGARRDTLENYLKRLSDLEAIANSFEGIEKSYALQAGREIRIFVEPDKINDIQAKDIARQIAQKIENELKYPGEIKITLIRENRVVEYAR
jgi:ribonucrease Y